MIIITIKDICLVFIIKILILNCIKNIIIRKMKN